MVNFFPCSTLQLIKFLAEKKKAKATKVNFCYQHGHIVLEIVVRIFFAAKFGLFAHIKSGDDLHYLVFIYVFYCSLAN